MTWEQVVIVITAVIVGGGVLVTAVSSIINIADENKKLRISVQEGAAENAKLRTLVEAATVFIKEIHSEVGTDSGKTIQAHFSIVDQTLERMRLTAEAAVRDTQNASTRAREAAANMAQMVKELRGMIEQVRRDMEANQKLNQVQSQLYQQVSQLQAQLYSERATTNTFNAGAQSGAHGGVQASGNAALDVGKDLSGGNKEERK